MHSEMSDDGLYALAERVGEGLRARGLMLSTAESCTGGWASTALTAVPGSSAWFERGYVTYSNAAKQEMLGVKAQTLAEHGAVSEAVVREMADGAGGGNRASLAISGVAGPGGGSEAKPVGLVCLAWRVPGIGVRSRCLHCPGGRAQVRREAVVQALEGLVELLAASP